MSGESQGRNSKQGLDDSLLGIPHGISTDQEIHIIAKEVQRELWKGLFESWLADWLTLS